MTTRKNPVPNDVERLWAVALCARRHESAWFSLRRAAALFTLGEWAHLAEEFRAGSRFAASSAAFRIAAEKQPLHEAQLWLEAARDALARGERAVARQLCLTALQRSQEDHVLLGGSKLLMQVGAYSSALPYLHEAVRVQPEQSEPQTSLALLAGARGDHAQAVEHARAALAAKPRRTILLLLLADHLMWWKDHGGAASLLDEAEALIREAARRSAPRLEVALREARLSSYRGQYDEGIAIAAAAMREGDPGLRLSQFMVLVQIERRAPWRAVKAALSRAVARVLAEIHEERFAVALGYIRDITKWLRGAKYLRRSVVRRFEQRLQRLGKQYRLAQQRWIRNG